MKKVFTLVALALSAVASFAQGSFTQKPLPYAYNALEPYIDAQTMEIHYSKHHAAYVKNLNAAMANQPAVTMDSLLANISKYSGAVRNNAGGHYNHELFWSVLSPTKTEASKELMTAINSTFTSMDSLKTLLNEAAMKRFGSGWAWLYVTKEGKLAVGSTANQDNPLMDVCDIKGTPILGIDVWEHAYYLKYQNKRNDYLSAIWNVINWQEVSARYAATQPKKPGKFDAWPEIKAFHKILGATFHPSEEGNLAPVKEKSGELLDKANALVASKFPAQFDNKATRDAVKLMQKNAAKVDALVKKKASDKEITKALTELHDAFHKVVEVCSKEDHHDE